MLLRVGEPDSITKVKPTRSSIAGLLVI